MENYEGDLADIIRASGGNNIKGEEVSSSVKDWQFMSNQIDYPSSGVDEFGDPFSSITRDPLLHELDDHIAGSCFFQSSNTSTADDIIIRSNVENTAEIAGVEISRPSNNIFSRMLQISPNAKLSGSPMGLKPPMLAGKGSLVVENGGLQISSPRNTGIKRRKSQAKKVVCIPAPAPAPANSRPSGEVVPSDLWAWRKYGQKPIKGSPYPRGYYRCSSSKGCSARKQVERSKTDPNMLVITYTSEHNHPWPTQRNALAGSTRTQLSKTTKGEQKDNISSVKGNSSIAPSVKEEMQMELSEGFQQSSNRSEDFFADLGELETDPLNLLFTQGYSGDEGRHNKASIDPFAFYDWTGNNSHENNRRV